MSSKKLCDVYVREWWKPNPAWPDGREPFGAAPKEYIARNVTEEKDVWPKPQPGERA